MAFFADEPPLDLALDERPEDERELDELFPLLPDELEALLLLDDPPLLLLVGLDFPELDRPEADLDELFFELDLAEPERPELELPPDLLREEDDEDLAPFAADLPVLFDRDEPPLELDAVRRAPSERPFSERLLLVDEVGRLPVPDVMVSAAAPTAPTAAPVAAPDNISPATSTTLSTIDDVLELRERDELLREDAELFRELPDLDLVAMYVLPNDRS